MFLSYLTELSGNGGRQVSVTRVVKICNPDYGSQFPKQTGPAGMDYGSAQCSPTGGEAPLSKEENPLKKETEIQILVEAKDNLLQDLLLDTEFSSGCSRYGDKNCFKKMTDFILFD